MARGSSGEFSRESARAASYCSKSRSDTRSPSTRWGVSVGSADGRGSRASARIRGLVDEIDPFLVSGHLAWSTHRGDYLNDLLPLPYDDETLRIVAAHVHEVQDALGRPYIIENPASYVGFDASTMTEVEFLARAA